MKDNTAVRKVEEKWSIVFKKVYRKVVKGTEYRKVYESSIACFYLLFEAVEVHSYVRIF